MASRGRGARNKYETVQLTCQNCGGDFWVKPYRRERAKSCSVKCSVSIRMQDIEYVEKLKKQCGSLMKKGMQPANSKNWRGENHPNWKGGKSSDKGYVLIRHPETGKYVREHRFVMEQHLGRKLRQDEHVHHKNHIIDDNRIENLEVMNIKDHGRLHGKDGGKWSKYGI